MKRGRILMTVLAIIAVLFVSCSNGLSSDSAAGGASTKTVNVTLGVDIDGSASQKSISSDDALGDLTFWYKATPQWTQDYPIHGGTSRFVQIPSYSAGSQASLGKFTAGPWLFEAEVRKGSDVIYSGNVNYTIDTGNTELTIVVTADTDDDGSVSITVEVPTTGNSETLTFSYVGLEHAEDVEMTRGVVTNNLRTFTATVNDLTPGAYTFSFEYTDNNGTVLDTGAAQAVNVYAGQTSEISGLIDGKHWVAKSITIKCPGFSAFTVVPNNDNPAQNYIAILAPSTNQVFTASATTLSGNAATYAWRVDGEDASVSTATFTFNKATPKLYTVTCIASDGTDYTESISIYVTVGYGVNFGDMTNGTVALTTADSVYAAGDIVPLTISPANGYHIATLTVEGVAAGNIAFDTYSNTGSFVMPAQAATVTATFAEDN